MVTKSSSVFSPSSFNSNLSTPSGYISETNSVTASASGGGGISVYVSSSDNSDTNLKNHSTNSDLRKIDNNPLNLASRNSFVGDKSLNLSDALGSNSSNSMMDSARVGLDYIVENSDYTEKLASGKL